MSFAPRERVVHRERNFVTELFRLVLGLFVTVVEVIWKSVGARGGLQEVEEYGGGFQGWYWRGSVYSLNGELVGRRRRSVRV